MANYIVGDIQACYSGLRRLLDKLHFEPGQDTLWAVGDLIGRGPQAEQTLAFFLSLGNAARSVLGNHDLHFLAVTQGVRRNKTSDGFSELLRSARLDEYVNWLRHCPLACELPSNGLICHAGLYPQWSVAKALRLSAEVERTLVSDNWHQWLANMYGNFPDVWSDELEGQDRLRFIVNAFTRMRYLRGKSKLDFTCKLAPEDAEKKLKPWFKVTNQQLKQEYKVIFGHWASLDGDTCSQTFIGLDTGYIWGGKLTALHWEHLSLTAVEAPD